MSNRAELPKRFTDKVIIGEGCWEWKAYRDKAGYGHFRSKGTMVLAHRYAFVIGVIIHHAQIQIICFSERIRTMFMT